MTMLPAASTGQFSLDEGSKGRPEVDARSVTVTLNLKTAIQTFRTPAHDNAHTITSGSAGETFSVSKDIGRTKTTTYGQTNIRTR